MRKTMLALAAAMLGFAAVPAAAQDDFANVRIDRITGAAIEQLAITNPEDLIKMEDGSFVPKDNARISRPARRCTLDAEGAQAVATLLAGARRSPEQWPGLGADSVIRFQTGGKLIAVLRGPERKTPDGEMKIFFSGIAAFLSKDQWERLDAIMADAGCPFYRYPKGD